MTGVQSRVSPLHCIVSLSCTGQYNRRSMTRYFILITVFIDMTKYDVLIDNEVLTLSINKDGYWLYDKRIKMNLSMRALTERSAFMEALAYYQKRLASVETLHNALRSRVHSFMENERWKERDESEESFLSSYR